MATYIKNWKVIYMGNNITYGNGFPTTWKTVFKSSSFMKGLVLTDAGNFIKPTPTQPWTTILNNLTPGTIIISNVSNGSGLQLGTFSISNIGKIIVFPNPNADQGESWRLLENAFMQAMGFTIDEGSIFKQFDPFSGDPCNEFKSFCGWITRKYPGRISNYNTCKGDSSGAGFCMTPILVGTGQTYVRQSIKQYLWEKAGFPLS
jgi:hypothetical protein